MENLKLKFEKNKCLLVSCRSHPFFKNSEYEEVLERFHQRLPGYFKTDVLHENQYQNVRVKVSERNIFVHLLLPSGLGWAETFSRFQFPKERMSDEEWLSSVRTGSLDRALFVRERGDWIELEYTLPVYEFSEAHLEVAEQIFEIFPGFQEQTLYLSTYDPEMDLEGFLPALMELHMLIGVRISASLLAQDIRPLQGLSLFCNQDHEQLLHFREPSGFLESTAQQLVGEALAGLDELVILEESEGIKMALEELFEVCPDDGRILLQIGDVLLSEKKPKKALRFFKKALEDDCFIRPDRAFNGMAEAFLLLKEYNRALTLLEESLSCHSFQVESYLLKAKVFRKQKNFKQSVSILKEALEKDPFFRGLRHELGEVYLLQRSWQEALEFFREEIEFHPDYLQSIDRVIELSDEMSRPILSELYRRKKSSLEEERGSLLELMGILEESFDDDYEDEYDDNDYEEDDFDAGDFFSYDNQLTQLLLDSDEHSEIQITESQKDLIFEQKGCFQVHDEALRDFGVLSLPNSVITYEGGTYRVQMLFPYTKERFEQMKVYACANHIARLLVDKENEQIFVLIRLFPFPVLNTQIWRTRWGLNRLPLLAEHLDDPLCAQTPSARWDRLYRRALLLFSDVIRRSVLLDDYRPLQSISALIKAPESSSFTLPVIDLPLSPEEEAIILSESPFDECFSMLLRRLFCSYPAPDSLAFCVEASVEVDEAEYLPGLLVLPIKERIERASKPLEELQLRMDRGEVWETLLSLLCKIDQNDFSVELYRLLGDGFERLSFDPSAPILTTRCRAFSERAFQISEWLTTS